MGALNQSYNTSGEPVYDRDEITAHKATDFRLQADENSERCLKPHKT